MEFHQEPNKIMKWNFFLMNLWGNGFSYTNSQFSLNGSYAELHKQTIYIFMRFTLYNYDKIIFDK
jgi:hypothetical protein